MAWMAMIFAFSSRSDLPTPEQAWLDLVLKKSAHAFVFGVLNWLYLRAMGRGRAVSWDVRLVCAAGALLYALSDEYHQSWVPGRKARWFDVAVDGAGITLAAALHWTWQRWRTAGNERERLKGDRSGV